MENDEMSDQGRSVADNLETMHVVVRWSDKAPGVIGPFPTALAAATWVERVHEDAARLGKLDDFDVLGHESGRDIWDGPDPQFKYVILPLELDEFDGTFHLFGFADQLSLGS